MTYKRQPIAKYTINAECNVSSGFSSLIICPNNITVYASSINGQIYAYNTASERSRPRMFT